MFNPRCQIVRKFKTNVIMTMLLAKLSYMFSVLSIAVTLLAVFINICELDYINYFRNKMTNISFYKITTYGASSNIKGHYSFSINYLVYPWQKKILYKHLPGNSSFRRAPLIPFPPLDESTTRNTACIHRLPHILSTEDREVQFQPVHRILGGVRSYLSHYCCFSTSFWR